MPESTALKKLLPLCSACDWMRWKLWWPCSHGHGVGILRSLVLMIKLYIVQTFPIVQKGSEGYMVDYRSSFQHVLWKCLGVWQKLRCNSNKPHMVNFVVRIQRQSPFLESITCPACRESHPAGLDEIELWASNWCSEGIFACNQDPKRVQLLVGLVGFQRYHQDLPKGHPLKHPLPHHLRCPMDW